MLNLKIKLKRWSVEEIEKVTGRSWNESKIKIEKETKNRRVLRDATQNENEIETKNERDLRNTKQEQNEKEMKNRRVSRISKQNENKKDAAITNSNKTNNVCIDGAVVRCVNSSKAIKKNKTAANTNNSKNENKKESTNRSHSKTKRRIDSSEIVDASPASKKLRLSKNEEEVASKRITRSEAKINEIEMKLNETTHNSKKNGQMVEECSTSKGTSPNETGLENKKDSNLENVNRNIGTQSNQIEQIDFCIGEVVWAKIRGYPGWPARIESIYGDKRQTFRVYWFNDYRTSNIYRSQIYKFHLNFEQFSKPFDSHIGLETAAREALMYLAKKNNN